MKLLRSVLDKAKDQFEQGGKLEKLYPLYEMIDTFLYTPRETASASGPQVRDGIDLKRMMITVAVALTGCLFMACYNTGLQANLNLNNISPDGWRYDLLALLGLGLSPQSFIDNFVHGALYFVPVFLVTNIVGGFWEALFATVRKHEINEGFLVTGLLFPLTLPPTIPLWQVAIGITFGVIVGKELFGGTGKNFLNPALTARVFLFFAYPAEISGDAVWIAIDGFTGATALGQAAQAGMAGVTTSFYDAFIGFMPGSMGETSTLACLIGAFILIASGIGSWKIMLGVLLGMLALSSFLHYGIGSATNPMFSIPPHYHIVLGGFAFAAVFMATDPVSASATEGGKLAYGFLIGCLGLLIRVLNPAFPEGWMLAILFANLFAPLIDHFFLQFNIKRRILRSEQ